MLRLARNGLDIARQFGDRHATPYLVPPVLWRGRVGPDLTLWARFLLPLRVEMPEFAAKLFDAFLRFAHLSVVDHHVMLVGGAIDSNGAEGERVEANGHTSVTIVSPAL